MEHLKGQARGTERTSPLQLRIICLQMLGLRSLWDFQTTAESSRIFCTLHYPGQFAVLAGCAFLPSHFGHCTEELDLANRERQNFPWTSSGGHKLALEALLSRLESAICLLWFASSCVWRSQRTALEGESSKRRLRGTHQLSSLSSRSLHTWSVHSQTEFCHPWMPRHTQCLSECFPVLLLACPTQASKCMRANEPLQIEGWGKAPARSQTEPPYTFVS